jgi:transposase InsO family protein
MTYPLVRELAVEGTPVRLTCEVLDFSDQAFYLVVRGPSMRPRVERRTPRGCRPRHPRRRPEFGYRFISEELRRAGHRVGEGRVHRLCREHRIWSTTNKKGRRISGKFPGSAVHDDLIQWNFTAPAPDRVWLTDMTEHGSAEGTLYCCAIKDVFSNRIFGYATSDRMTAALATSALRQAVARRRPTGTVFVHSDRGGQGGSNWPSQHLEVWRCSWVPDHSSGRFFCIGANPVTEAADSRMA